MKIKEKVNNFTILIMSKKKINQMNVVIYLNTENF